MWKKEREKNTNGTDFILHFQINYYHLTSVLWWSRMLAEKRRFVRFFRLFSLYLYNTHFYAVSGYHLWCDDVGYAADINIHTLCKQEFTQNGKEMNETRNEYSNLWK